MLVNKHNKFSTREMTYDAKTRTFSCEASTIGFHRFVQIFDDACDEGVYLESHKTGKIIPFTFTKADMNDGDVCGWWLESYSTDRSQEKMKLLIIND